MAALHHSASLWWILDLTDLRKPAEEPAYLSLHSPVIQKEVIGHPLLGPTWEHLQSKTIKTNEKTQRPGDLNHCSWQRFSIHQISSAGNLTEAWCRNGLGLTLIFCLYYKAKVWLLPGTPGEIPRTLLSTNIPGRRRQTSSRRPFQVTMWDDTDIWHALSGIFRSEAFLALGKLMVH